MLKKLESYYDEDHEQIDISDEKIYWDTQKNQFRHKFECEDCGKFISCFCFDELHSALSQIHEGMTCEECSIKYAVHDMTIDELLGEMDTERGSKAIEFMESLLKKEDVEKYIEETGDSRLELSEKLEIIDEAGDEQKLKDFVVSLLTEDEKQRLMIELCDFAEGEACNL